MRAIAIAAPVRDALLAHARRQAPDEAVGLLSGPRPGVADAFVPLPNRVSGPGFAVHPRDQFDALMAMRRLGRSLVATFHSHPNGAAAPSDLDLRFLGQWPCPHVIAAVRRGDARPDEIAAFSIGGGAWRGIRLRIVGGGGPPPDSNAAPPEVPGPASEPRARVPTPARDPPRSRPRPGGSTRAE